MKILIKDYAESNNEVSMNIRIEQELQYFNYEDSLGFTHIEISKSEYMDLSEDEYKTLAYKLTFPHAIKLFKQGKGYKEEKINPVDFKIVDSKPSNIKLDGSNHVIKYKGEDLEINNTATLYDQYNNAIKTNSVTFDSSDVNDKMTEIEVVSTFTEMSETFLINISVEEKQLTENEKLQQQLFIARTDAMRSKQEVSELKELLVSKGVIDSE